MFLCDVTAVMLLYLNNGSAAMLVYPTNPLGIDLTHDSRHVGFAFIMQISYTLLRGQTTQVREVTTNILATQMICFTFIECLSPKK